MSKQKREQLILLIAGAVFVIMAMNLFFGKKSGPFPSPDSNIEQEKVILTDAGQKVPEQLNAAIQTAAASYDDKDPFDIPVGLAEKMIAENRLVNLEDDSEGDANAPKINLEGIVWGPDTSMAFIDGKVYRKGDSIADAQIIDIDKKGVYLLYNGERVLVRMKKKI